MSGIEERGLRTPQTRMPGKSHVSSVILTANPWEIRNFDRKMVELEKMKVQKERQHFWAQRQFLMTHAFDNDTNLRFADLDLENGVERDTGNLGSANDNMKPVNEGSKHVEKSSRKKTRKSLGIFAEPLPENFKRRSAGENNSSLGDQSSKLKSISSKIHDAVADESFIKELQDTGDSDGKRLPTARSSSGVSYKDRSHHGQQWNQAPDSWDQDKPLCEAGLILALTQTLPTDMMVKANTNLNADAHREKERILVESRELNNRDALQDARWKALIATLEDES